MVKQRRRHTATYKFRIALDALEGSKTISQLSSDHVLHPSTIRALNRHLLENGRRVFCNQGTLRQTPDFLNPAEEHFVVQFLGPTNTFREGSSTPKP
ncbi:MAG: transposase [Bacteroidota bacterium]|nr:transposase [Bacteroidota bacterium]